MPFRSAPLPVDVRTRVYVGVGHAGNAIDLFRFREENRRWREQSVDVLLRNPKPFVGERVSRFVALVTVKLANLKNRLATFIAFCIIIYCVSFETFAFITIT